MTRDGDEATYWEARARALEERVEALQARVVALAGALPAECVEMLEMDVRTLSAVQWTGTAVSGIDDTHGFVASDVETELSVAWQRLRR